MRWKPVVIALILVLPVCFFSYCGLRLYLADHEPYFSEERFETIKPGWTKRQVLELLGNPDRTGGDQNESVYQYERRPKSDPKKFSFLNMRDYVIVLNRNDLVVKKIITNSGS